LWGSRILFTEWSSVPIGFLIRGGWLAFNNGLGSVTWGMAGDLGFRYLSHLAGGRGPWDFKSISDIEGPRYSHWSVRKGGMTAFHQNLRPALAASKKRTDFVNVGREFFQDNVPRK